LMQFKQAAGDKGYLTRAEAMQSPYFQGFFDLGDRDRDGKLTEKELTAVLDLQEQGAKCFVTVTVVEQGRGLFEVLDANRDGRLGLRELRRGWDRVSAYERGGAGYITRSDLPRQIQFFFNQGEFYYAGRFGAKGNAYGMAAPAPAGPQKGPLWFRKM